MKLYHYATWSGQQILSEGLLRPSDRYRCTDVLLHGWAPVVWLTIDPRWEPSVQASYSGSRYEKCGSCPVYYTELGIPCWRFEAELNDRMVKPAFHKCSPGEFIWEYMLDDARRLGSDPMKWWVSFNRLPVINAYRWRKGWKRVSARRRAAVSGG